MDSQWPPPPVDLYRVDFVARVNGTEKQFSRHVRGTDATDTEREFWRLVTSPWLGHPYPRDAVKIVEIRVIARGG